MHVNQPAVTTESEVLRVEALRTHIRTRAGLVKAAEDVSFVIRRGESVGLVGESGSGKTITCLSIMRLLPLSAEVVSGRILFNGTNLVDLPESAMRRIRGREIAMIMQDPMTALNPILTLGDQVGEAIRYHLKQPKNRVIEQVIEGLKAVRIPRPEERLNDYPHQFSGGMRQRIVAAMGLISAPDLILADEPTTALDVTIQAQFLSLIRSLQQQNDLAMLWITHDLGVVAQTCDRVNVMYAGRIVESGDVRSVFREPLHPYTSGLLKSVPKLGVRREKLYQIEGQPPDLLNLPAGCPFYARCPLRMDVCREEFPPATHVDGRVVHCWATGAAA